MKNQRTAVLSEGGISLFEKYLQGQLQLSELTRKNYLSVVRRLLKRILPGPSRDPTHSNQNQECVISLDDITELLAKDHRRRARAAVVHFLRSIGWDEDSILQVSKVKEKGPRPREIPTYEEFMKVIEGLDEEERMIALFLLNTGARGHEALKLRAEDINKEDGRITMETKGGDYRVIMIPKRFLKDIMDHIVERKGLLAKERVFYTDDRGNVQTRLKKFWDKLTGVSQRVIGKGLGTHDFRRHYGTYLYEKTGDIELVRRLMGHKKMDTTIKYTQYATRKKDLEKATALLDELGSRRERTKTAGE